MKKLFYYFINLVFFYVAKIIPKDKTIWFFGSWFGKAYSDNSRYFFEYVNKFHPEIRAVWITSSKETYDDLSKRGFEVYMRGMPKAYFLGLRAGASFYVQTNLVDSLPLLNNGGTKMIELWHGIPLKKIGFDDKLTKIDNGFLARLKLKVFPFLENRHDMMIACSKNDQKNFLSAFSSACVKITGYPRNDYLESMGKGERDILRVLYLPTFRGQIGSKFDLFDDYGFEPSKLSKSVFLRIKTHYCNSPSDLLKNKISNIENIEIINEGDAIDLLNDADILITDYSSVFFDFLLTEKPIIFAPFDYDKYISMDRELYYDYDKVTPGPKCKNWDEVFYWIEEFSKNKYLFIKERQEVKNNFHLHLDGMSCKRVFNEVKNILNS